MTFSGFIFRHLRRRPLRSALTILGIGIAVGAFVTLTGLAGAIERAWRQGAQDRGTDLTVITAQSVTPLLETLDAGLAESLAAIPGVKSVAGELFYVLGQRPVTVFLGAVGWTEDSFLWDSVTIRGDGRRPRAADGPAVLLGQVAAALLEKEPGDEILLRGRPFRILGIFSGGGRLMDSLVLMRLETMQSLRETPERVSWFSLQLDDPGDQAVRERIQATVQSRWPELVAKPTALVISEREPLKMLKASAWAVSLVALVIGLLGVTNTLLMAVVERTREIGILSAVGWSRSRVVGMVVLEGSFLGVAGGLVGTGLGFLGLGLLAGRPEFGSFLEPAVSAWLLLRLLLGAGALGALGSLYPAARAASLNPVQALRHE